MDDRLYKGRPGFQYPYEGPTRPEEELPENWESYKLSQMLAHKLRKFTPEEMV